MTDYLDSIKYYYEEMVKSGLKDKNKICKKCSAIKQFKIEPGSLKLICSPSCENQIHISLAEYEYYPDIKLISKDYLQNYLDLKQLKDVLHVSDKIEETEDKAQSYEELLVKSKKAYMKQNDITNRFSAIKKYHKDRIQMKKEQCLLMKELKDDISEDRKHEIYKEYISIGEKMKSDYMKIHEKNEPINNFLIIKEGSCKMKLPKQGPPAKKIKEKKDKKETKVKELSTGESICIELSKDKLSKEYISTKRKQIYDETIKKIKGELTTKNLTDKLTNKIIVEMYLLYDEYFFKNKIKDWITENGCNIAICWADQCSKDIYGKTLSPIRSKGGTQHIKIELNDKAFIEAVDKFLQNDDSAMEWSPGVECNDLISCIQLTFEHELIHGLMFCFCNNYQMKGGPGSWTGPTENKTGHSKTFMSILNNLFGHTNYTGSIGTDKTTIKRVRKSYETYWKQHKENKEKYKVGDTVTFKGKVGKETITIIGKVKKKNPKKIIIIEEGNGNTWNIDYAGLDSEVKLRYRDTRNTGSDNES